MTAVEKGSVKELAIQGWRDVRSRPAMWLLLSASWIPLVFGFNFLAPGSPANMYYILNFVGYGICFALAFMFWCMAVLLFEGDVRAKKGTDYESAYSSMRKRALPILWTGLVFGLASVFMLMFARTVVAFFLSFAAGGAAGEGSQTALNIIYEYLSFLVADLALVLLAFTPQMLSLEGLRKVDEVLRSSYMLIKERYKNALLLFIIPDMVIKTLYIAVSFVVFYLPGMYFVFAILLVFIALLEGGKTAFLAAAFNRFYYRVLEEEKKKRKKKKAQARKKSRKK